MIVQYIVIRAFPRDVKDLQKRRKISNIPRIAENWERSKTGGNLANKIASDRKMNVPQRV